MGLSLLWLCGALMFAVIGSSGFAPNAALSIASFALAALLFAGFIWAFLNRKRLEDRPLGAAGTAVLQVMIAGQLLFIAYARLPTTPELALANAFGAGVFVALAIATYRDRHKRAESDETV